MTRLVLTALTSALLAAGATLPAFAALETSGPIVIAPARTEIARDIKAALLEVSGVPAAEAQSLYFLYGERYFEPIWFTENETGLVFSEVGAKIVSLFERAGELGLRPEDYLTPAIDLSAQRTDRADIVSLETAFSASVLRYANHVHSGRIRPQDVSVNFDIAPKRLDEPALLRELLGAEDPVAVLEALEPDHPQYLALKDALARFDANPTARPQGVPAGATLRLGEADFRVPLLRTRFGLPASASSVYDADLFGAVEAFQRDNGLEADGVIGPATIAALNGGDAASRDDIVANLERWRWMPEDLGQFHVFVNVPQFELTISDQGRKTYSTRVVVGRVENQTPIFSDMIRHIVVNPFWNVPGSIISGEVAPAILRNPAYVESQNMELLYQGSVIDPWSVNWSMVAPSNFPFRVRQRPGTENALGQIKFLFPNKHDVYLHDTPSKSLFSRAARAFSHGCIRVEDPMAFAGALTAHEPNIDRASLEAMFGPSERWVNPAERIPVHIAYFTLQADENGELRSFGDVYGHNQRMVAMMNGTALPPTTIASLP